MSYYLRILGKTDPAIPLRRITDALEKNNLKATITLHNGSDSDWTELTVVDARNRPLFKIERDPVEPGELGSDELQEFRDEIADCKPAQAAKWLSDYLNNVRVVYAFQILGAVDDDGSWAIVDVVKAAIWEMTGGILQADHEGFSNEQGDHILWQFYDDVTGLFDMAVLNADGVWVKFQMDLGDAEQRREFKNGLVPKKARVSIGLKQKGFLWGGKSFEITNAGLKGEDRRMFGSSEFFVDFENVGLHVRRTNRQVVGWLIASVFFLLISIMVLNTEGAAPMAAPAWLTVTGVCAAFYFMNFRRKYYLVQKNGRNAIEFLNDKPSKEEFRTFIAELRERSKVMDKK